MPQGVFSFSPITEYYVTCADCNEMFVIHWRTMRMAKESAREEGWRVRDGLWRCPEHAHRNTSRKKSSRHVADLHVEDTAMAFEVK